MRAGTWKIFYAQTADARVRRSILIRLPFMDTDQNSAFEMYTGGYFQTNAYALPTPTGGKLLIDAPEGCAAWLQRQDWKIDALLLTHAHIDHIQDAAEIVRGTAAQSTTMIDGIPLLEDRMAYRRFGLSIDFEPVTGGRLIDEGGGQTFAGREFDLLTGARGIVRAACVFTINPAGGFTAATMLFAGSVGRSDLPGGDHALLLRGIRQKILTLPDDIVVLPRTRAGDHGRRRARGQSVSLRQGSTVRVSEQEHTARSFRAFLDSIHAETYPPAVNYRERITIDPRMVAAASRAFAAHASRWPTFSVTSAAA